MHLSPSLIRAVLALICLPAAGLQAGAIDYARSYTQDIEAVATGGATPEITLHWTAPTGDEATEFVGWELYRRQDASGVWGQPILSSSDINRTSYTDTSVSVGTLYEYRIRRERAGSTPMYADGYCLSGIELPYQSQRGGVALVIDDRFTSSLAAEIDRLQRDLRGDGWTVHSLYVSGSDSPASVRSSIQSIYNQPGSDLKAVLLLGHVPLPRAGHLNPDGHHRRPFVADAYYGEMDGAWSDALYYSASNAVGDGVFDAADHVPIDGTNYEGEELPFEVELWVGRIDMHDLPGFTESETELLRRYLDKNHAFRHGQWSVRDRAFVANGWTNSNLYYNAYSGFRNAVPLVGAGAVDFWTVGDAGGWKTALGADSYLLAYGTGSGTDSSAGNIVNTGDFAAGDYKGVFHLLFGSYFCEFEDSDNLLRAAIASRGYALTSLWGNRPVPVLHHMGMGLPIGFSLPKISNNHEIRDNPPIPDSPNLGKNDPGSSLYWVPASDQDSYSLGGRDRALHFALMGDPTLRSHPVAPVSALSAVADGADVLLQWTAPGQAVDGYHVYRGASMEGPFQRLTANPINATGFTDTNAPTEAVYMVRTVALQTTASGSYWNGSQGIFAEIAPPPPAAPTGLQALLRASGGVTLSWLDNSHDEDGFRLEVAEDGGGWALYATLPADSTHYTVPDLVLGRDYDFRINAYRASTESAYTGVQGLQLTPSDLAAVGEVNGFVVIEAEVYDGIVARTQVWDYQDPGDGHSGTGLMVAGPANEGHAYPTNYETDAPRLDYTVNFREAGTYYLWVRGKTGDNGSDSLHVGINGNSYPISGFATDDRYSWSNTMHGIAGSARYTIPTAGQYTVHVWIREDGLSFDKLILTRDSTYTPSGNDLEALGRQGIEAWRKETLGSTEDAAAAADTADPDADGRINLLEYALLTDPLASSDGSGIEPILNGPHPGIRFVESGAIDLNYYVEAVDLLGESWSVIASRAFNETSWTGPAQITGPDADGTVTVEDTTPLSGQRFFRLRVEPP